jgi:hypothetical protein
MLDEYHNPEPFRYNLNGFLQALRSVTLYLQREGRAAFSDFDAWYSQQQDEMREDPLLRRFLEGRNLVAHARQLIATCDVEVGLFRNRRTKMAFGASIDPRRHSAELLQRLMASGFIEESHMAIGEQGGVWREWKIPDLDKDLEAGGACHIAWARIVRVVALAHERFIGADTMRLVPESPEVHDVNDFNVLLEMDLDPTLPAKWGWVDDN